MLSRGLIGTGLLTSFAGVLAAGGDPGFQPRMGEPLHGLAPAELSRFEKGKAAFTAPVTPADGLGPIFNDTFCGHCHLGPAPGGSSSIFVTRFGKKATATTPFDPLESLGGSLLQALAISSSCAEVVPPEADVSTLRITPHTFGAGLAEAIPDGDLLNLEAFPPAGVSGKAHVVQPLEDPTGPLRVGRFGWKSQVATVLTFSGDAARNEQGFTNRLVPTENAPNGNAALLALCDGKADPEDGPDAEGFDRIDRFTDFQRFLAPPPQTPRSGMAGESVFNAIGCAACHVPSFVTGAAAEAALSGVTIKPYSDFLLHDMGSLGDGIVQGMATEQEFRTAPLWGLKAREALLHDGRATGGDFVSNVTQAIAAHDGEGAASAAAFAAVSPAERGVLLAFLGTLGQPEFDWDDDLKVTEFDWFFLQPHLTGPGSFFEPDDRAAIADVDQDGDFDLADFGVLQRAFTGP